MLILEGGPLFGESHFGSILATIMMFKNNVEKTMKISVGKVRKWEPKGSQKVT